MPNSFEVGYTFVDNLGHPSSVSPRLKLEDIPDGATLAITIAVSPKSYVTARKLYSTLANDIGGPLYFVKEISDNTTTSVTMTDEDDDRLTDIAEAPTDNNQPPAGYRHITFWKNRIYLGNKTDAKSKYAPSKNDNADAYPTALQGFLGDDDGGEIRGFLRSPVLIAPKSSTTWVFPDDIDIQQPDERLSDYGCEDERSMIEVDGGGVWHSEKGFIFFDGFNAKRMDANISLLSDEYRAAPTTGKASVRYRRFLMFFYTDPLDANKSKALLFDTWKNIWLLDTYAFNVVGLTFNREAFTRSAASFLEGLVAIRSTDIVQMDNGTTDLGAAIVSQVNVRPMTTELDYHEANWDSVTADILADAGYSITFSLASNDGNRTSTITAAAATVGRETIYRRCSASHVGRYLDIGIQFGQGVRFNKLYAGYRKRQRRAA